MGSYIDIIKTALLFFPVIAFFISFPFILIEYHKYGSISLLKTIIIYSFILYLLCAYFLIILPLPKFSEVKALTTPKVQLIPFEFIIDFIKHSSFRINDIHTYITALKESYFYVPLYNIFLTLPFGMYLKYYFKCSFKKTIFLTFCLSLFFELTQLSGLYFIYPRGYRLFDVDDLFLNTIGGTLGYLIMKPLSKLLPKREDIDYKAIEKGKNISGLRKLTTICLDLFLLSLIQIVFYIFLKNYKYTFIITSPLYYLILPLFFKGQTFAEKFLNIQVVDYENNYKVMKTLLRRILFFAIYILMPFILFKIYGFIHLKNEFILGVLLLLWVFIFEFSSFIKFLFTKKELPYETLSKTKLLSTIKHNPTSNNN